MTYKELMDSIHDDMLRYDERYSESDRRHYHNAADYVDWLVHHPFRDDIVLDNVSIESISCDDTVRIMADGHLPKYVCESGGVKRSSGRYTLSKPSVLYDYLPNRVIFNGPATICFFSDGSKEVVKKSEFDVIDDEKAVLYCIMKHLTAGNYGYFKKALYRHIDNAEVQNIG